MQQSIIDRFEKARDQIVAFKDRTVTELTHRADGTLQDARERVRAGRTTLEETRERITQRADEALHQGQGALREVQATVLESARDALGWAGEQLGPRAEFVRRGEQALTEALVALRAGHSATLPIEGFDVLSVKAIVEALDAGSFDAADLDTLRAYEAAHKARKTLLRELDRRLPATDVRAN